jgi:hypothetical protein
MAAGADIPPDLRYAATGLYMGMKHTSASGGQRTMEIIPLNPPTPPFGKGGQGGFPGEKVGNPGI